MLVPLALLTNQLGFWLVRRTREDVFYKVTMIMMFLIGLALLRVGVQEIWRH